MKKDDYTQIQEDCQRAKRAVSKYGITIVCDEEDTPEADLVLPASDSCEKIKSISSKLGYQVVCEEES